MKRMKKKKKKKARWELHKNATYCFEKILEAASHSSTVIYLPSRKTSK